MKHLIALIMILALTGVGCTQAPKEELGVKMFTYGERYAVFKRDGLTLYHDSTSTFFSWDTLESIKQSIRD